MKQTALTDQPFAGLDLHPRLQQALAERDFEFLTPIQAKALPLALQGKDVAGRGQTGTGKTLAFLLTLFDRLLSSDNDGALRALVLAPTRELAIQIHRDAVPFAEACGLKLALAYGGVDYDKQRDALRDGRDILIGTPGRIIDYFKQKVFHLRDLEVVVLDEADRMFDMGFIKDIRFILNRTPDPKNRQGLLFSATLSQRVLELAYEHMNQAQKVETEQENVVAMNVDEAVFFPANQEKIRLLIGLLQQTDPGRTMVFVNTRVATRKVCDFLQANGFSAGRMAGDVHQKKRQSLLKRFHEGDIQILVATDVAARGLHIPDVSHVFNFDLPTDAEDYVHRIGRTARLGESGDAMSFACENFAMHLPEIEAYIEHQIPRRDVTRELLPEIDAPPRKSRKGGGRGRGRSDNKRGRNRSRGRGRRSKSG